MGRNIKKMEPLQFFEDAHCSVEKPSLFVPRQKGLVIIIIILFLDTLRSRVPGNL